METIFDQTLYVGFGAPNAGKGTALKAAQLKIRCAKFGYLSTGDYIRSVLGLLKQATRGEVTLHDPFLLSLIDKLKKTEKGELFSAQNYKDLLLRGLVECFDYSQLKPGCPFFLDGGIREPYQFDVVREICEAWGYKRFVMLNFKMTSALEWDERRKGRLSIEGRADDEFEIACKKYVLHLMSEELVLPLCESKGFELIEINAHQPPNMVLSELITVIYR